MINVQPNMIEQVQNVPGTRVWVYCIIERACAEISTVAMRSVDAPWADVPLHLNPALQHPEYNLFTKQLVPQGNHI